MPNIMRYAAARVSLRHPWGESVLQNFQQRKLAIVKDVPVHGARESFADMVKTIKAKARVYERVGAGYDFADGEATSRLAIRRRNR